MKGFEMNGKFGLTAIFVLVIAVVACAATWTVDPAHSNVTFSVKHMMVTPVHGNFGTFSGTATFDEKTPADVSFEGTVDATTINTNNERRNGHLKSADFFDVANYPTITFKSTKTQLVSPGVYKVTGDLTMHGVKKEVVLDMEGLTDFIPGPKGGTRTGASLSTKINRQDFGLKWNRALEAGGVLVGDMVQINIDVELEKAAPESAN
jgi:polyisoprenoid-binding protein YceI